MGKQCDVTAFEHGMIVGARSHGASISKTAECVKCSRAAVVKVFKEWTVSRKSGSVCANCGRQRLVNVRAERRVARLVQDNRMATVHQITADLNQGSSQMISERAIRRTLHSMGYGSRRPVRTPLLSAVNKIKLLQFAQKHKDWTVEHWKKVMWSDESRFQLHHADDSVRIWQKQHENMHPTCMSTTLQAGGGSFMVWGPLICVEQPLNSTTYQSIVADKVHPIMLVYLNGDGFFQQDNAPSCHGARIVQEWFQEHEGEFTLLQWPPESPDLNPIDYLWEEVERAIRQLVPQPSNLTELDSAIHQAWCKIPRITFQHLVKSMPRRIAAALKAQGGPTKY
uniref:Transposase n=1 Tax=Leptobrachium leishanense TaxID=445787 RepID=A0A8C5M1K7_9ANUR